MDTTKKTNYLGFLEELMACTNTTKADLARGLNTSWQNIQDKFNLGDVKISKAEELAGVMGYKVRFVLDDGSHTIKDGSVQKNVGGLLLQINDLVPQAGRMEPLRLFLRLHGKSMKQVAQDIGVSSGTVMKYFRDDDAYISRLFWIADAYGWKVQVQVDRKQPDAVV